MPKVTIRISDELFKKLGHYCVDADKSVNRVMTELLEKLLAEAKKTKPLLSGPAQSANSEQSLTEQPV